MTRPHVLFRVAAGPRLGFGHLVRAVSLARALGIPPVVALRGGREARSVAQRLRCRLVDGPPMQALRQVQPAVVVLDEPPGAGSAWTTAAKTVRSLVVSIVDGTAGPAQADLVVDGNVSPGSVGSGRVLAGPRYMILDPEYRCRPNAPRGRRALRIVVALGGGHHAAWGAQLVRTIVAGCPRATIERAAGLMTAGARSQAPLLAAADIAVTAGGVSAYEACALRVATVAVAVVREQRRTVSGLAECGAVLDGGVLSRRGLAGNGPVSRCARAVQDLAANPTMRGALRRRAGRLVDGRGGERVAHTILGLLAQRGNTATW